MSGQIELPLGVKIRRVEAGVSGFDSLPPRKKRNRVCGHQSDDKRPIVITGRDFCPIEAAKNEVPW